MGGTEAGGWDWPLRAFRPRHGINALLVLWLSSLIFVFGACSSEQQAGKVESLEERVKGFWDARVAGDDAKAYNYEAFSKTNKMTLQQYLQARNPALKYDKYEVKKVEEKGDEATVTVDVGCHLVVPAKDALNLSMAVVEPWVRLEGQWYRQLPQSKL
jgi:hypothetical protein